jgi:hypothetical protein
MNLRRWIFGFASALLVLWGTAFTRGPSPTSDSNPPPGPDRYTVIAVEYNAFEWYMLTWKGHKISCSVIVDHEGLPLPGEVYRDCGEAVYDTWITQKPCVAQQKSTCQGYYTFLADSRKEEREIAMQLAPASAWISLEDCEPVSSSSTNICESTPTLVIRGVEPLPNESIVRIEGTYDGRSFHCDEAGICKFHIGETAEEGVPVEFWSYSSYGDSSLVYTAQVRARQVDEGDPDQLYWYVDVLSSQWEGPATATCSDSWGVFPPVGGPPQWLTTPRHSEDLSSDIPYTYLAANLILQGAVDAGACPDGGLAGGGVVNQCGLEAARAAVNDWQDRFDELILSTAEETGVPARLLKNLFARESQFWPGIYQAAGDIGLGQLTENGADTTLFWNRSFFHQFCPLVLEDGACNAGYMHLNDEDRSILRRALVGSVNASCEECPLGLDLTQADFSVGVFAHTMIANCEQAGQVVRNYTGSSPGDTASYEDLWKFTLVNYNAGGGCLAEGLTRALGEGLELTWENVSPFLGGACSGAVDYVNDISG